MKVTVCQLSDDEIEFLSDWQQLKVHLAQHRPNLVLLPEMPFGRWLAASPKVNEERRLRSIQLHQDWLPEIEALGVPSVVYSMPVIHGNRFLNTAYVYREETGHVPLHSKAYFPQETHFWEESWFTRQEPVTFESADIGNCRIGVLLCTELWFTQWARHYGQEGIDLLLCPRATSQTSVQQWIDCGKVSAIVSGAYCLSSNRSGLGEGGFLWGGAGWVTQPGTGNVLTLTSSDCRFSTIEIDLETSRDAKVNYPLNVLD
nr:carbon-nitrogen hydrolase family protein [uncultured Dyadobacter sp.]